MSEEYPHYRRNFIAFAGDWTFFVVAMAFVNYTSVIPSFVNQLTDFAPLIGLVTTIGNGVWLLPQLIAANYVGSKRRKKSFVMAAALVGRPVYLLVPAVLLLKGDSYPWLILGLYFLAETIFTATDGLATLAWFDILSRSIPPAKRGRLYTTGQIGGGLLSFAAGFLVGRILGPQGPAFPHNYSLLFVLCVAFLFLSLAFFSSLKEQPQQVPRERQGWRIYIPRLVVVLRQNQQFRLVNVVRLLAGLGALAMPFYVVYATDILGVSDASIGFFVSAQVLGSIAAGLAMGYLNERTGSKNVTILTIGCGLATPLLALLIHYRGPQGPIVTYVYALVFFLIGANYSGYTQGFTNFVLEISPSDDRPTYLGLYNTLGGTLLVLPMLGGWLLQSTSYPVLFGATAIGVATSLALSFLLVEPRRRRSARTETDGDDCASDI